MTANEKLALSSRFRRALSAWGERVKHDARLSSSAKLAVLHIAEAHLRVGRYRAWPSHAKVARAIGKSEKTVQRGVNDAAKLGYLQIERGKRRSNEYVFPMIEKAMQAPASDTAKGGQACPTGETSKSGEGGQECPPKLKKEVKKNLVHTEPARFASVYRFGLDSPQARAWNRALSERGLGSLDDYEVTETLQGDPDYAMPSLWPPESEAGWPSVEEHLRRRSKLK